MVVKFLKPSASFGGVDYNFNKIALGTAELMLVANYGALNGLDEIRPSDYLNYLTALSALNEDVKKPQIHVAISTSGREHDKTALTHIAGAWMEKMGYGKQPYFVVFHRDTDNNHVHIVSTRIDHDGRKISSGFEHIRSIKVINEIMGLDERQTAKKDLEKAMSYHFSTLTQFKLIIELQGYIIKENDLIKFGKKQAVLDFAKLELRPPDQHRATQLKAIFKKYAPQYDEAGFIAYMKTKMGVEIVLHSKDGKPVYGYTILDHARKNAYKGSEIMPLKTLNESLKMAELSKPEESLYTQKSLPLSMVLPSAARQAFDTARLKSDNLHFTVSIANDVDDDQINGPCRRRKRKARTNTR
jgi:hypothetical protein